MMAISSNDSEFKAKQRANELNKTSENGQSTEISGQYLSD